MAQRKKVMVTGAAGVIAGQLLPFLREQYELSLLDVRKTDPQGKEIEEIQTADLHNRDRDSYRHHFRGV